MSKFLKFFLFLAVAGFLLRAQPATAQEGVRGNLVDVHWLQKNLQNPDVIILDASPAQLYKAQHIPGALNVNVFDLFAYGFGGKAISETTQVFQTFGISLGKKLVMYDPGGTYLATRLFFDLTYQGYPAANLFVLDGGLSKWQAEGLPVTNEPTPAPKKGTFTVKNVNGDVRGELPEVLTGSGDSVHNALLEGLDSTWHFGQVAPFSRAGHIPNGIMTPVADFFNADKTFKSPEEIKKMLSYLGVKPEQQIYTYCGGGLAATVPFFAAKYIASYPRVKLYRESELGYLSDPRGLPFWTYDAPYLIKERDWLQLWTGPMIRTYLGSQITILDVRSVEAFNQGHIPFSLNIPPEVFRSNLANPGKLAEILGEAGVNASQEAVVISGAGITKESALAFVELEKLGQSKISLFMDSSDKWAQLGFTLTKDPTLVGTGKGPQDLSIPRTTYPVNLRSGVIVAGQSSTQGIYPKVFIASGKEVSSRAQDGKVVHVAYTDLLNPDGTPKAAKDIWTILSKAGVPRYAELICFSDDPGEAAVNYFILKLMGYPDVKVLTN